MCLGCMAPQEELWHGGPYHNVLASLASLASPHSLIPDSQHSTLGAFHTPLPSPFPNKSIPPSKFHSTFSFCTFINQLHLSKMHRGDWVTTVLSLQNCSSWGMGSVPTSGAP